MNINLTTPLYLKILNSIKEKINDGVYPAGSMLPSERELINAFSASRGTVRKAYDILAEHKLVIRQSGVGAFVAEKITKPVLRQIGLVIPSLMLFDKKFDPLNRELRFDVINGILASSANCNSQIKIMEYQYLCDLKMENKQEGFILLDNFPDLIAELNQENIPYSFYNMGSGILFGAKNSVGIDVAKSYEDSIDYLIKKGHKRIALLNASDLPNIEPYKRSLKKEGICFSPELVENSENGTEKDGYEAIAEIFSRTQDIDAIFCKTDIRAFGVLKFLKDNKIRVPNQMSVMGFDNITRSANENKSLTTFETPRAEIGEELIKQLCRTIKSESHIQEHRILTGKIVERKTVADRRKA